MQPQRPTALPTFRPPVFFLLASVLVGVTLSCASSAPPRTPINAGAPLEMAAGEGILIVQIDTDLPLASVDLRSGRVATNLPSGQHLWLVRAKAGSDEWARFKVDVGGGSTQSVSVGRADVRFDDEFEFDVEAGKVNYPGELIVRSAGWSGNTQRLRVRNRNHSAMAVRRLRKRHGAELDQLPLRYGGRSEDEFLSYYTRIRDEVAGKNGKGAEE